MKNDKILSLFFNNFGTVIVLVQVLPNITSLSAALILIFFDEDMVSRLNQLKKIKSSVALLRRLLIIINMLCLFIKNRFIYFKYTNKWFLFYHMHKNWLEKPLDFSVQTPEPETVLFRGKDDPLCLFFCLLLHKK